MFCCLEHVSNGVIFYLQLDKMPSGDTKQSQMALPMFGSSLPAMDTMVLMNSVQKIVQVRVKSFC